jgi:hypothetical protein
VSYTRVRLRLGTSLGVGHWLAMVDVSSVPLSEQQGLCALVASTFSVAAQHFPNAQVNEQLCPLFHEANSTLHPPLFEGGTTSDTGGPTASGSVARRHLTGWRVVVRMHHLLICCRPPYYGMGSFLYQVLEGCALWPGWTGRVVFILYHLWAVALSVLLLTVAAPWQ